MLMIKAKYSLQCIIHAVITEHDHPSFKNHYVLVAFG